MRVLRVIGDVHAQMGPDDVARRHGRSYREIIAGAEHSVQIGDMGDDEAYGSLVEHVDPARHRFFGGNHEQYDALPPHALGDFGAVALGGVEFFFVRGAASMDKIQLLDMGLWAFGHYHRDWSHQEGATLFRCIGELSWIDVGPDGEIMDALQAAK